MPCLCSSDPDGAHRRARNRWSGRQGYLGSARPRTVGNGRTSRIPPRGMAMNCERGLDDISVVATSAVDAVMAKTMFPVGGNRRGNGG